MIVTIRAGFLFVLVLTCVAPVRAQSGPACAAFTAAVGGQAEYAYTESGYAPAVLSAVQESAQTGCVQAQFWLGEYHEDRNEVAQSVQWLQRAADAGHAPAQYLLAQAYAESDEIGVDPQRALALLRRSAAQGYAPAQEELPEFEAEVAEEERLQLARALLAIIGQANAAAAADMVGKHPSEAIKAEPLRQRFQAILGASFDAFEQRLQTASEVTQQGDHVFGSGCQPHSCSVDEAAFAISTKDGSIAAGVLVEGKLQMFGQQSSQALPAPLSSWQREHLATQPTRCDELTANIFDMTRPRGVRGVEFAQIDANAAIAACKELAAAGGVRHMYQLGRAIEKSGNPTVAAGWYRKAAEQGFAPAQNALANFYSTGKGAPRNDAVALDWYAKSAAQGFVSAKTNLGGMYLNGMGVGVDHARAMALFREAAAAGDGAAFTYIGMMYHGGHGVQKSTAQALSWYRKGEQYGDSEALYRIGYMYQAGEAVLRDNGTALAYYRRAAAQGHPSAQQAAADLQRAINDYNYEQSLRRREQDFACKQSLAGGDMRDVQRDCGSW